MDSKPEQPPEGRLIELAMKRAKPRLSGRKAAALAGISEGRWRQLVSGYSKPSASAYVVQRGPAETIARMAQVVGVTPERLEREGERPDAAAALRELLAIEGAADQESAEQAASTEVRGVGGAVIDLPLPVKVELEGNEVHDFKIIDLPGSRGEGRIVALLTGPEPKDLDQARRDLQEWSRRMRAMEAENGGEDDSPPAANDH